MKNKKNNSITPNIFGDSNTEAASHSFFLQKLASSDQDRLRRQTPIYGKLFKMDSLNKLVSMFVYSTQYYKVLYNYCM